MITHFIEAAGNDFNHGKFMLARLTGDELATRSALPGYEEESLIRLGGLRRLNERSTLVMDLQTGEGAVFFLDGYAVADLNKTRILVCPLFEPFLVWLYQQGLGGGRGDITALARYVELPDAEPEFRGHRRAGNAVVLAHADGARLTIDLPADALLVGSTLKALGEAGWIIPQQAGGVLADG